MKTITRLLLFFVSFLAMQKSGIAQPFTLDEIQPQELVFTEYKKEGADKAKGRISVNQLSQDKDTMYYFIQGLNMYAPTYFSLNSAEPDADIKINLCKENWKKFHRTGQVKGKTLWKTDFKTEGDFGIMVVANKKPANYVLMVWTGDEMKIDMPTIFKSADKSGPATGTGGGWFKKNMTLVIVAAIALLIISFLLVKLKKKNA
jgi:hypothetical protein